MGIWVLPNANSLDVIDARPQGDRDHQRRAADRHAAPRSPSTPPSTSTAPIDEVAQHAARDGAASSMRGHLPVPRLAAHGARAAGGDPGLADRRRLPDAGVRLHAQPAHAAGDRARGRSGGRRRDRRGRERRAAHPRGQDAARGRAGRRARAGRADHRDDHHAGRRVRADRLPGRPHRRAVPRVRVHARRRGVHLRHRGADAVADDVVAAAQAEHSQQGWLAAARSTAPSTRVRRGYERAARRHAAHARPRSTRCGSCSRCCIVPMYMFSPAELAPNEDQGVVFGALDVPANATLEQLDALHRAGEPDVFESMPEFDHSFQITFPTGGFGGMLAEAVGRAQAQHLPDPGRARGQDWRRSPASARPCSCPPALPSAGFFPVEFVIASTASHEEMLRLRRAARRTRRRRAGSSPSRRSSTCSIDQAKTEIVIDRDKVASMGLSMQQVGARPRRRCSAATSSTASTSTAAATRSSRRSSAPRRLTPEQLDGIYVTGPGRQAHAARRGRHAARAASSRARSTASSSSTRSSSPASRRARSTAG